MRSDYKATKQENVKAAIKADTVLQNLKTKTPAEIDTYIDNLSSIADLKEFLKKLAKLLIYSQ